eukprot:8877354-Alexandrium_andersonii.AAC.1
MGGLYDAATLRALVLLHMSRKSKEECMHMRKERSVRWPEILRVVRLTLGPCALWGEVLEVS